MAMMVLYVDQNLGDEDDASGLKSKHVAWFLINIVILPLCSLVTLYIESAGYFHYLPQSKSQHVKLLNLSKHGAAAMEDEVEDPGFVPVMSERSNESKGGNEADVDDDWDASAIQPEVIIHTLKPTHNCDVSVVQFLR
mmetsp:Transcript_16640/g.21655  ORF Transcript_16640/g.21655 Transcript_16640/m.21655 type:complete len:138 (+) Transcript_16640:76-489(+)|eukprot:CAMPEP_0197292632 /NCGR_PEP_ID=MMETSP0890-20130614/24364_1 /TAXON_ID=44058 ORGANISM="Aureoumbra lagunensis, Strain CCMP1510" /NCGR_SAMPLE_ID=MMETSP0890 /ASSEMBLY_ACC=CAM_ASM_000533 /LENGTH=137 /DNA_ID=CAMNT_0042766705 /DNA_START=85 /DNA_END=498 /DNA_ORIENTATION=+